jgi:hypothetical protein
MQVSAQDFLDKGWCRFAYDEALAQWVGQARPAACAAISKPENSKWLRCGGTWFVGVNALPNGTDGALAGGSPLAGAAVEFIRNDLGLSVSWDRGQVSVVYPGYPRRMDSESAAAFRFRCEKDAAHLDGALRLGASRRRSLQMFHTFILGIPLVDVGADHSPLVVWERSHEIVRRAFQKHFADLPVERWPEQDITELYQSVRRAIFETCRRVAVTGRPGEAYLVHRLALHGIAPWAEETPGPQEARAVIYFRPEMSSRRCWLESP